MKYNVTTPKDILEGEAEIQVAILAFEEKFKTETRGLNYYHLVIQGELSEYLCKRIESIYQEVGWSAECKTSSMNGERYGLTGLQLRIKN